MQHVKPCFLKKKCTWKCIRQWRQLCCKFTQSRDYQESNIIGGIFDAKRLRLHLFPSQGFSLYLCTYPRQVPEEAEMMGAVAHRLTTSPSLLPQYPESLVSFLCRQDPTNTCLHSQFCQ